MIPVTVGPAEGSAFPGKAVVLDGVGSLFNLVKIQASACLAFMEFFKNNTQAARYFGKLVLVGG
jgi:hypothetical protein